MKKRVIFLGILILFKIPFLFAADEKKVTLTTYYPAPYGEYKTLKASESITVTGPSGANEKAVLSAGGSSGTGLVVTNANKVGIGTTSPKGILDLASTKQAFFPPRVTTSQRNAIASVTTAEGSKKGAVVYNTDTNTLETYDGNKNWKGAPTTTTTTSIACNWTGVKTNSLNIKDGKLRGSSVCFQVTCTDKLVTQINMGTKSEGYSCGD